MEPNNPQIQYKPTLREVVGDMHGTYARYLGRAADIAVKAVDFPFEITGFGRVPSNFVYGATLPFALPTQIRRGMPRRQGDSTVRSSVSKYVALLAGLGVGALAGFATCFAPLATNGTSAFYEIHRRRLVKRRAQENAQGGLEDAVIR